MGWKEHSAAIAIDLKKEQDLVAQLRYRLAEREEELVATLSGKARRDVSTGSVAQVGELVDIIKAKDEAIARLSKEAAQNEDKILTDFGEIEQKVDTHVQEMHRKIQGLEEELEEEKAKARPKGSISDGERKLRNEVVALKKDKQTLQAESQRIRGELADSLKVRQSLANQLQAEKAANMKRHAFMTSDPEKEMEDEDDEEELPDLRSQAAIKAEKLGSSSLPVHQTALSSPPPTPFKRPKPPPPQSPAQKQTPTRAPPSSKKRKSSAETEAAEELATLTVYDAPTGSRRRNRPIYAGDLEALGERTATNGSARPAKKQKSSKVVPDGGSKEYQFDFRAIVSYDAEGEVFEFYRCNELLPMGELWERIELCARTMWEAKKGEAWSEQFKVDSGKAANQQKHLCVSQKCQGLRTTWRGGEGMFACKECVKLGRPCFTFVCTGGWGDDGCPLGEFRLLPLHEGDRVKRVKKDYEIRHWIDDEIVLVDTDEVGLEED
ncbi:uncharacterized protein LTR77_010534 [Saxophila tyrrhenica]|uniref:Uncharacterized protein n=1 Tax=Saxophila tyrrhenica TaxID=1690608 RepID=A0AAV9NV17_9PEZI|nr:hypothetical protein LTR77_010534 [Saxophila tyrrhenica]